MKINYRCLRGVAVLMSCLAWLGSAHAAPALQNYDIDPDQISVSGLSSGGFMAVQLHVAFSDIFMGVGSVAGGVYYCAEGSQMNATGRCMDDTAAAPPSGGHFRTLANQFASQGKIAATSNMSGDKVWLFTGSQDSVVRTEASDRARDFYEFYTSSPNIAYSRNTIPAEHAMVTQDYGDACGYLGSSFASPPDQWINDCNYDAAGEMLQHIYGSLVGRGSTVSGNLLSFDQSEFTDSFYIGDEGYIYVPDACEAAGANCRLHIALHGCLQNKDKVGDKFARHAGYNQWAETNNIVVVYPQTSLSATNQCWDWWGYADLIGGGEYQARSGSQMKFIKALVDRVTGDTGGDDPDDPPPGGDGCFVSSNSAHASAGRATVLSGSWYYAKGSWAYMGNSGSTVTPLREDSPGHFVIDASCE